MKNFKKIIVSSFFCLLIVFFTTINYKAAALDTYNAIALNPRNIILNGSVRITDDEYFGDQKCTGNISEKAIISPNQVSELIRYQKGCGGEVRVEMDLNTQLLESGDVKIIGEARLYEGTSESTSELEDTESIDFIVPVNNLKSITIDLLNTEFQGGDKAKFILNFANSPN